MVGSCDNKKPWEVVLSAFCLVSLHANVGFKGSSIQLCLVEGSILIIWGAFGEKVANFLVLNYACKLGSFSLMGIDIQNLGKSLSISPICWES